LREVQALLINRLSGAFIVSLGLLLYFIVIPAHTEIVDYGWMRPQSIPNACAILLVFLGIVQTAIPTGATSVGFSEFLRVSMFALVTICALWAMANFGFLAVTPLFVGALMLLVGERRIGWLLGGVIVLPLAIWLTVVPLLERTLP
tara:strand:+ start:1017 stop:1454 length:438 start_codon:yes stop_codon:yes gene_type:complete